MAQHGVFNLKTSTVSIFKDRGSPEHQMTNSGLLFTQCAITVPIFSAQNIMHYLFEIFFFFRVFSWLLVIFKSVFIGSHIWFCNAVWSGHLRLVLPVCVCVLTMRLCSVLCIQLVRWPWCWNGSLAAEPHKDCFNSRKSAVETWLPFSLNSAGEPTWETPRPWHTLTECSLVLMLLVTPAFNKSKCPTAREV